jgi:hypothetical protein
MSDDNNNENAGKPDLSADLLAKTDKLAQDNERLSKQLEALTSTLTSALSPKKQEPVDEEDLEALIYKDPRAYARKVEERASKNAEAMINNKLNSQNQANQVMAKLTSDYPELADANSELTKRAVEVYNSLSTSEKKSPNSYNLAVREAAAELGLQTKAKRKSSGDDFMLSGGRSGGPSSGSKRGDELSDATLEFAERLGMNIKDKKVIENLKARAGRKSWSKYS